MKAEPISPMEARSAECLPTDPGWQFEPKWDGFRCLASKDGGDVALHAKSGKTLGRFFPEIVALVEGIGADNFVLDGELVVPIAGRLSFGALQMRLHPAESRIRKLSAQTPAKLIVFDILRLDGADLTTEPLSKRRAALDGFVRRVGPREGLELSETTEDRAAALSWLAGAGGNTDGVVAKRLDERYQPGERAMVKVKRVRTADCVVGGFRYESARPVVGSLLLGLYDEAGKLDHVGFTSSMPKGERPALTKQLVDLRQPPGFTGRAPGGPSRWSTERSGQWEPLAPELVVEVAFDQVTDGRFRHGTKLVRWRPDKAPRQCTFEQIA